MNKYTCIFFLIATNVSLECVSTKCDVADFNTHEDDEDDSQSGMHYKFIAICFVYIDNTTKTVIYEEQKHLPLLKEIIYLYSKPGDWISSGPTGIGIGKAYTLGQKFLVGQLVIDMGGVCHSFSTNYVWEDLSQIT